MKIENAKVRVMKDASAAYNAYQSGELSQVELDSTNVAANKDNPEFSQTVDFRTTYIQFNLTDDVVGNVNMRQAISHAIDRNALTEFVLADGSVPGNGLIADGMYGDGEKTFRELNGDVAVYDVDEAKKYYDEALKELGEVKSLTVLVGDDSVSKSVATFLQSELSKNLGLTVEIDTKTMQGRGEQMDANNYQVGVTAWGADYDDAMTYLDLWTKKLVAEDAVVSPIYHKGSATLTKSNVKNLITHPIGVPMEFKYAYFE